MGKLAESGEISDLRSIERRQLKDKVKFMVVSGEDADKIMLNKDVFLVITFEMGSISVFRFKVDNK